MSPSKAKLYRCNACEAGRCAECLDVTRVFLDLDPLCPCTRKGHKGEPHGAPEHVCNSLCEMVNGRT